jgi:hypothetical protein
MSPCDVTILVSSQAMHEIIRRTFQRQHTELHPRLLSTWTWRRVDCHKFAVVSEERTASILNSAPGGSTILQDVDTFHTDNRFSEPRRSAGWREDTVSEWNQVSKLTSALSMKICLVYRSTSTQIKQLTFLPPLIYKSASPTLLPTQPPAWWQRGSCPEVQASQTRRWALMSTYCYD